MNSSTVGLLMDQISVWAVNVLLQVTVIAVLSLSISSTLRRSAAARHGLLCSALLLVLSCPVIMYWMQRSGTSLLTIAFVERASASTGALDANTSAIAVEPMQPSGEAPLETADIDRMSDSGSENDLAQLRGAQSDLLRERLRQSDMPRAAKAASEMTRESTNGHLPSMSVGTESGTTHIGRMLRSAMPPILLIWLLGASVLLIKLARGFRRLVGILRSATPCSDPAVAASFLRACRTLQAKQMPQLLLSSRISGPISAGLLRPCVVLPEEILGQVTPVQLYDVLIHEIAHIVRRDQWIVLLQNIVAAFFWLHPLVKLLNQRLAQAREEVCDNYVLASVDAPTYSRTLLALATLSRPVSPLPGSVGLFTSRWRLEWRVAGLLSEQRNRRTCLSGWGRAATSLLTIILLIVAAFGTISIATERNDDKAEASSKNAAVDAPQTAASFPEQPDDGLLTLNLIIREPDGLPAANAIVESLHQYLRKPNIVHSDQAGRATIRDVFGNGVKVQVRSIDGNLQKTLSISAQDARRELARPVELKLNPAVEHRVIVTAEERPAADVQVIAEGWFCKVSATTGPDGVAWLKLPSDEQLREIAAWDANRGIGGVRNLDNKEPEPSTKLSLYSPAPFTIRLIDQNGVAVPNIELGISVQPDNDQWIICKEFADSRVRTNELGEAVVYWMPQEKIQYADVDVNTTDWKIDEIDVKDISRRIVTVHVRRQKLVHGRLTMPDGASASGILITGFAFGPGSQGAIPEVRAQRDGSFMFRAPSQHAYVMGVSDRDWASERWTGLLLRGDDAEAANISMSVYAATPLTVRVTRGSDHEPVKGAWVHVDQRESFSWIDASGKKQNASGSIGNWLTTDSDGLAYCGVGNGQTDLRLTAGKWTEERTLKIKSDEPIEVLFHRDWSGNRKIIARMTRDGTRYLPSSSLAVRGWTNHERGSAPTVHQPIVRDDKSIELSFDDQAAVLLVIDRGRKFSGYVEIGPKTKELEIAMQPTASYTGTILDEDGKPLADRSLKLSTKQSFIDVVEPQRLDASGRFHFSNVPAKTPLRVDIVDEEGLPEYFMFEEKLFEPGEDRAEKTIQVHQTNAAGKAEKTSRPLIERLTKNSKNISVAGLYTLVVLEGDATEEVTQFLDRLEDSDDDEGEDDKAGKDDDDPISSYLPLTVSAAQVKAESALIAERKWTQPKESEIALIALDADQKKLAEIAIDTRDADAALQTALKFLQQHRPLARDARAVLAEAQQLAKSDGRKVCVVIGGPRCGPCFQFAQFLNRNRTLLEKDYVIVKLMAGHDKHVDAVDRSIGGYQQGVPWYVITDPDGKILISSQGPLGNIGMPSSVEDIRHFRTMIEQTSRRLSASDIDKLIQSLKSDH